MTTTNTNATCTRCLSAQASEGALCWSCYCDQLEELETYYDEQLAHQEEREELTADETACVIHPLQDCIGCNQCNTVIREDFIPRS